jgi:hypothetical protein
VIRWIIFGAYLAGALALGVLYAWEWLVVVLLVGVVPGLALAYLVARGGEWLSDSAARLYDEEARRHPRFWR